MAGREILRADFVSFYLLHDLVLIVMARIGAHYLFHGQDPTNPLLVNLILVFLSVLIAACVASMAHRWIEMPFIRVGKRLAARVASQKDPLSSPRPVSLPGANVAA
jgi:peptidoglycan/LPS O-acetylase OafA/YrhL